MRYHLRPEQRIRLRLPARQYEVQPGGVFQREHNFAIVDEVDSILIDEARTPLIISGASEESTDTYYVVDRVIPRLKLEEHYTVDEKLRTVATTEEGVTKVEELLGIDNLYDPRNIYYSSCQSGLARACAVQARRRLRGEGREVVIVDEFHRPPDAGATLERRLHQAIEAKENVRSNPRTRPSRRSPFQNYFRMYKKLAGMTGTADTEAVEFKRFIASK